MRIHPALFGNGRRPQNPNKVPLTGVIPLKLREVAPSGKQSTNTGICIEEMTLLFACMKANNFTESVCQNELGAFKKCYKSYTGTEAGSETFQKSTEAKKNIKRFPKRFS